MTRLPLAADVATGLCSLHAVIHVPRERHGDVFAEFARVLEPGGELLVTTDVGDWDGRNDDWLSWVTDDADTDGRNDDSDGSSMRWSFHGGTESRALLAGAGFDVREETVVDDELGGGEWLFVPARLTGPPDDRGS